MGEVDKFNLKWNDFERNIIGAFKDLRTDRDFFDVSLVVKDQIFHAHRVILAACSPAFREMIRNCSHHHPVLYLRGVSQLDMAALLEFMYHGETSLAEEELETFMATAEDLQVRGLTLSQQQESERSRRVSGSNLATAVDDDVNNLLAGLDDPTEPPAAKRVKQEPGGKTISQPNYSITPTSNTPAASAAANSLAEKIRIKQEKKDQPDQPTDISVESAKQRLASLPNSISMQRVNEPPTTNAQSTKPPITTTTAVPAAPTQAVSLAAAAPKPTVTADHSAILKALNISSAQLAAAQAAAKAIPTPKSSTQITSAPGPSNHQQPQQKQPIQQSQPPPPQQQQQVSHQKHQLPPQPHFTTQQQRQFSGGQHGQVVVPHPPQATNHQQPHQAYYLARQNPPTILDPRLQQQVTQHPGVARVAVQQQAGGRGSPPVLHLPEGFNNFGPSIGTFMNSTVTSAAGNNSPALNDSTESGGDSAGGLAEDPEYQRQIEAYIEKVATAEGPKLMCKGCSKVTPSKARATLINHIESNHIQANVLCNVCNKSFKARSYLRQHQKRGTCTGGVK